MGSRYGSRCDCLRRETGLLHSRARQLVIRVGEILWGERTRNTEAQNGDFASKVEKGECDADDGSLCTLRY